MRSMLRSTSRAAAAALTVAAALAGCAFDDGLPWGQLEVELAVSFAPEADRLDDEGRLKTVEDYRVRVDAVEVTLGSLTVSQLATGADASFDPAAPPAGYTLCHNGHCHHDSGALVSYDDIAAELAGGASAAGPQVVVAVTAPVTVPFGASAAAALGDYTGDGQLARGAMGQLSLPIVALTVRGQAFDALTGAAARLPPEGVAFDVTAADPATLTRALGASIDRGEPVGLRLATTVVVPATLFDGVDWSTADVAALPAALTEALAEDALVEVVEQRFEID